ncbi:MAG: NUDIX hydrolase [Anaerolineae bacterium]|nr:NUDIX hydrolase [Anaerolineae bacterium]
MQPWKTRSRRTILDRGKFLVVEEHSVELPDGRVIDGWPWVISPDFVNVVAVTPQGELLCFRQTKYAVEGVSFSVVGGYIEEGENPLTAAQRELLEETGYQADEWTALGCYPVDGNRGAGKAHFFLARGARPVAEIDADDLEEQQLLLLSRFEVETALLSGEFKLLPWAAIVGLALHHLDRS